MQSRYRQRAAVCLWERQAGASKCLRQHFTITGYSSVGNPLEDAINTLRVQGTVHPG
jgi:hypothetical protein